MITIVLGIVIILLILVVVAFIANWRQNKKHGSGDEGGFNL